MTRPDWKGRSPDSAPSRRAAPPSPEAGTEASSRRIAATLVGGVAGAIAFAILLFAGFFFSQRLLGASPALWVLLLLFGAGGAYAAWLAATMAFAAVRGGGD